MTIRTVAFLGAGNMGAPMARRARQAGFDILICDRNPAVLDAFSREGARVTQSAADCADADAIIVLLANDAQIMSVITGEDGLAQAIPRGRHPIVCMMSTTLPDTLRQLQEPLRAAGARLIDAPISGGIVGAENGTLTIMIGGDAADVVDVTPLMRSMGQRTFHCGGLGSAEVVKVINNMICVTNMFLTAEAVQIAVEYGVSLEQLSPILSVSTGLNFLTADAATGRAQYGAWARSEEAYEQIHQIVGKDLRLALKLAGLAGIEPRLLQAVSNYVDTKDPEAMARWMRCGGVR
jgi:3-hydroxyisobutyrate dehydrogenase-like beta-hydroxyacid dehydrogenase